MSTKDFVLLTISAYLIIPLGVYFSVLMAVTAFYRARYRVITQLMLGEPNYGKQKRQTGQKIKDGSSRKEPSTDSSDV